MPILYTNTAITPRRVFCVGANYADHAREMGRDPRAEKPFFFHKPTDALLIAPDLTTPLSLPYPPRTENLHHEVEMVVVLNSGGSDIPVATGLNHVLGLAVGLDMTRRDLQAAAKERRQPWDMAKGFDFSAPLSPILPLAQAGDFIHWPIRLDVDGQLRQHATVADMTYDVAEIIAELSTYVTLQAGDVIFTGTPAGVGPVVRGQRLLAELGPTLRLKALVA